MSSRDRDSKSLQDKLKVFFKKGASAPLPAGHELVVSAELERELRADAAPARRMRALRDLGERARSTRIHQGGVERLWTCTRDLLDDPNPEHRHTALWFLGCLAAGQECSVMRTIFFRFLRDTHAHHAAEDDTLRFKLLHTLTNAGKNIECFEEQAGAFLLECLRSAEGAGGAALGELLALVINVVKFNATYLDEDIVHGVVNFACHLCAYSAESSTVVAALALLEAVVAYSLLPRAALPAFVGALCRAVNLDHYCQTSWKLMRCVLGADIGHAALAELVALAGGGGDAGAVRGAVFYINMALWGPRRVAALRVSLLAVLPALLQAVSSEQPVVTYEVIQAVQSLVTRAPPDALCAAWDVLLRVLRRALQHDRSLDPPNELIHSRLHALLTTIEQLHENGQYTGDPDALLDLLDFCAYDRPEAQAMRLIGLRCAALSPARADWLAAASALGDKFVRREVRPAVRLHALAQLLAFLRRHRFAYEEEVLSSVGVPLLSLCASDSSGALRAAAARALSQLAVLATTDAVTDLVDLLEKIMNRPFESEEASDPDDDLSDVTLAVTGLLELFHARLLRAPAAHAARACLVLLDHLDSAYRLNHLSAAHVPCRKKILDMILGLRANAFNCVGFCYDAAGNPVYGAAALRLKPLCSPTLLAEPLAARGQHAHPPPKEAHPGTCVLPVGRCARIVTTALTREKDWSVLQHILRALPALLQARALCVGRRVQDLDLLASTLCAMVSDRSLGLPESLRGAARPSLSELHGAALPALAALAPYHGFLEALTQVRVVRCLLRYGMVLRTPQPYLAALTLFTLETRDTMVKLLPEVLLDLSKISDTQVIASPMLEFLSTLTRLPRVFASFVEDQYMSVFAILLPYTNPSRYNHYVVSLAHHVVAAWFLKCRLSYRRNFVRFIIHGLHNYIIIPFQEQLHKAQPPANEDSSNRKRSSSLGSRGVSSTPLAGARGPGGAGSAGGAAPASASAAFHVELTETCVDLLARYTSSPCSVKPHRSETAEWMFTGGTSMTWLVGHKLVTITTAGCAMNTLKQGMCDRCATLVRQHAESAASPLPPLAPGADELAAVPPLLQVNDGAPSTLQAPPAAPEVKRQNSAEYNPLVEALNNFTQRFEKISKEVDSEDSSWSRAGELAAAGGCPCWCADWAEIHVRSPSGDVAWLMRVQNQMGWDSLAEGALQDVAALLAPPPSAPPSSASSGIGDSRHNVALDSESRSRSGSSASQVAAQDLHKSSSDSVVAGERRAPHAASHCIGPPQPLRMSTQPINIPGSPVRAAHDDDMLLYVPEGKSRHPVRRSNSSPEMSSSWKLRDEPPPEPAPAPPGEAPSTSMSLHASKKAAKKSDMRVSCEAIPEEMSGSSPLAPPPAPHPHLCTYNSDPGSGSVDAAPAQPHQLQKVASDSIVPSYASKPPAAPRPAPSAAAGPAGLMDCAGPLFLNLEQGGRDGRYTYVWHDDVMQVLFHVATAMPALAADPTCNEKRKHIGNDYVSIVYNDSGADFDIHTIKGQLNLCIVVVEPLEHGLHRVLTKTKDERIRTKFLPHLEHGAHVVSDPCAAPLARQLALHCALASHISQSLSLGGVSAVYASNSLERLRHIKRLRRRVEDERLAAAARAPKPYAPRRDTARRVAMDDFNDYT